MSYSPIFDSLDEATKRKVLEKAANYAAEEFWRLYEIAEKLGEVIQLQRPDPPRLVRRRKHA